MRAHTQPLSGRAVPLGRVHIFALVAVLATIFSFLSFTSASSAASTGGMRFAVADDSWAPGGITADFFAQLAPKTYRLQVSYDAWSDPAAANSRPGCPGNSYRDEILNRILAAQAAGAQHIVVTLAPKYSEWGSCAGQPATYYQPGPLEFQFAVQTLVNALTPYVTSWSPANEPNYGIGWLPNTAGATKLAGYFNTLKNALPPSDEIISPDFSDEYVPGSNSLRMSGSITKLRQYINDYVNAGGGWGNHAAFHPYGGVSRENSASIDDFLDRVPATKDVWFTEIGAHPAGSGSNFSQTSQINWLINTMNARPRIDRAYYYNLRKDGSPWDSALIDQYGTPRPAFATWCNAANLGVPCNKRADVMLYSPTDGNWDEATSTGASFYTPNRWVSSWGPNGTTAGYSPLAGDFNGDGRTDVGIYDPNNGYWSVGLSAGNGIGALAIWQRDWGQGGPQNHYRPLVGDFNGDGKSDIGIYDPNNGWWSVSLSNGSSFAGPTTWVYNWGANGVSAGYAPLTGDFNGDGKTDFGIYDPNNGYWSVGLSTGGGVGSMGIWQRDWGQGGPQNNYRPLVGDFTGDGKADIGIYDPNNGFWGVSRSTGGSFAGPTTWIYSWGANGVSAGYAPLTADFNGDGTTDFGIYDPNNGYWSVAQSTGGGIGNMAIWARDFGLGGPSANRKPLVGRFSY